MNKLVEINIQIKLAVDYNKKVKFYGLSNDNY